MYYIEVIVPLPISKTLTYQVSYEEYKVLLRGFRVAVTVGKSKIYSGIVFKKHQNVPDLFYPKPIHSILDDKPIVTKGQLELWDWVSKYYLTSIGLVMKAAMPSAYLLSSESILTCNIYEIQKSNEISDNEFLIYEAIKTKDLSVKELNNLFKSNKTMRYIKQLINLGYISIKQKFVEKFKEKKSPYLKINSKYLVKSKLKNLINSLEKKAPKQKQIILSYLALKDDSNWISQKKIKIQTSSPNSSFKSLFRKKIFNKKNISESRLNFEFEENLSEYSLTKEQLIAYGEIKEKFRQNNVVLFRGVTSSGKTEVYFKLINEIIKKNKQVLYLVPEISITAQMVTRLRVRFGSKVLVYHSRFNNNERAEMWSKIIKNDINAKIILGARSSIFLPFKNLGLIVVDEEHESSFKQFDPSPRYHARDLAIYLGKILKIKTLLGSATPSAESYNNMINGKYGYVELLVRYRGLKMPKISVIDLKEEIRKKKNDEFFSDNLIKKINETIRIGKKIIIFKNRRGYAPSIECNSCGYIPKCENCDVTLTYHQYSNKLVCHYCGFSNFYDKRCLKCSDVDLTIKGFGTQKIEEKIQEIIPNALVERMDYDSTRKKNSFDKIIKNFESGESNILIGTQMVSKGLDFKNVGLVVIISADNLINFPDFRSHERCFQILSQVAGRAGRSDERGEVMLQTYNSKHILIKQIANNDFKEMITNQLEERKLFKYPPFVRLIKIILKSKNYDNLQISSKWLGNVLKNFFGNNLLGPVSPYISKIRNDHLINIIIKYDEKTSRSKTKKILTKVVKSFQSISTFRSVKITIDVDPQ